MTCWQRLSGKGVRGTARHGLRRDCKRLVAGIWPPINVIPAVLLF